ncbi:hypothetical protein CBL_14284 [Carabus blaptoides fortunei]
MGQTRSVFQKRHGPHLGPQRSRKPTERVRAPCGPCSIIDGIGPGPARRTHQRHTVSLGTWRQSKELDTMLIWFETGSGLGTGCVPMRRNVFMFKNDRHTTHRPDPLAHYERRVQPAGDPSYIRNRTSYSANSCINASTFLFVFHGTLTSSSASVTLSP